MLFYVHIRYDGEHVSDAGLDHKLVLLEGLGDPVGKEVAPDAPLVVSFDHYEDLSDLSN